jgi:hypothetical protein
MHRVLIALDVVVLIAAAANTLSWLAKTDTPYLLIPRMGLGKWLFKVVAVALPILALLSLLGFVPSNAFTSVLFVYGIAILLYSVIRRSGHQQSV